MRTAGKFRFYGNSRNKMAAVNTPANESGACLLVQPPLTSLQLSFAAAVDYLQHLIRQVGQQVSQSTPSSPINSSHCALQGRCYSGSCVESRGPPASQLQVEQSLPSLDSLSLADEAKFFAPTSSQVQPELLHLYLQSPPFTYSQQPEREAQFP